MPPGEAAFEANEAQWLGLVLLGLSTGARVCEVVPAKVGDLDLTEEIGVWTISRHSSAAMTDVYTRIPDEPRREAARKMGKVIKLRSDG